MTKIRNYAIKLTDANIDSIIEYGARHDLNLEDFRDDLEFNAADGFDTIVFMSVRQIDTKTAVRTFTTLTEPGFNAVWKFDESMYLMFRRVSKKD